MNPKVKIMLSSRSMCDVDPVDFDCWIRFVRENVDEACLVDADVGGFRFYGSPPSDEVRGEDPDAVDRVCGWLMRGAWAAFCGAEWNRLRAEAEAVKP